MIDDLADEASCGHGASALSGALEEAGIEDVEGLMSLDTELRAALEVYGLANDAALCAAEDADAANTQFLRRLSIDDNEELRVMFGHEPAPGPEVSAPMHQLRILARLAEDGRIELGVELADGEQILPTARHLPADTVVDEWRVSSDVELEENPIGRIRARRLDDGRVELGFLRADGEQVLPEIRYLPADIPAGVWSRSGEIEVPEAAVLE